MTNHNLQKQNIGMPNWLRRGIEKEAKQKVKYKPVTTLKPLSPKQSEKKWTELNLIHPLGEIAAELTDSDYPFVHQQKMIEDITKCKKSIKPPIILQVGTGSGKTFAFLLPALHLILQGKLDFAIICYPMKQLIEDQFYKLKKFVLETYERTGELVTIKTYHGEKGLNVEEKVAWEKELFETEQNPPQILLCTFDKIFYQLIHSEDKNCPLLEKIREVKYIVFDEFHAFKGLPAAYVHYFLKVHRKRNPDCQVILSTATIADTQQFGDAFFSEKRREDKQTTTTIITGNPMRGTIDVRAIAVDSFLPLLKMVKEELPENQLALVFVDSKKKIEEYAMKLGLILRKDQAIYDSGSIAVLHANLHQKIRKQALIDAREGKIKFLITSAVSELGIDLNNIQTIINIGWPVTGMDGILQRIARVRSKPGMNRVVYFAFDLDNPRDNLYHSNLSFFRTILEEYQCSPVVYPQQNQKVIFTTIILLLLYGYYNYDEIISFFDEEYLTLIEQSITILLCYAIIQKNDLILALAEPNSSTYYQLIASSIRAITKNWSVVFDEGKGKRILGFLSPEEILRSGLPGNILLINKIPYLVQKLDKEKQEIKVGLAILPSTIQNLPSNLFEDPSISLGLFPKKREVSSGIILYLGEITFNRQPQSIARYTPNRKECFEYKSLGKKEKALFTLEEKSTGIVVNSSDFFKDSLLALFSHKSKELLASLAFVLKVQIEFTLKIPTSEIGVVYNTSQLAFYDKGGGNGNMKYLFQKLPEVIEQTINRLDNCSCLDGCEKCFGRDFTKLLPRGKSKQILKQMLAWLKD
ncbi:MAG: DEAD/DEAH box helicase [Candidatus Heimdallarchaeota archaeon]|nr:DEAD/DEAH box helicase [Candidatus Heimdallarchaeota archaeon]